MDLGRRARVVPEASGRQQIVPTSTVMLWVAVWTMAEQDCVEALASLSFLARRIGGDRVETALR